MCEFYLGGVQEVSQEGSIIFLSLALLGSHHSFYSQRLRAELSHEYQATDKTTERT